MSSINRKEKQTSTRFLTLARRTAGIIQTEEEIFKRQANRGRSKKMQQAAVGPATCQKDGSGGTQIRCLLFIVHISRLHYCRENNLCNLITTARPTPARLWLAESAQIVLSLVEFDHVVRSEQFDWWWAGQLSFNSNSISHVLGWADDSIGFNPDIVPFSFSSCLP